MASADWVALGGLIVSCFAFAVSFVAFRLQGKTAKSDNEKELADQIVAILSYLAQFGPQPADPAASAGGAAPPAASMEAFAKASNINAALQTLLLRVGAMIDSTGIRPDWYQNLVLASAAVQIGEPVMAGPYAKEAVNLARHAEDRGWNAQTAAMAQMFSLQVQANFYYNRGRPEDLEAARADLKEARRLVRDIRHEQGPFATVSRLVELYVRQADFELDLGDHQLSAGLMAKACHEWQEIRAPSARQAIGGLICSFAHSQGHVPADTLLPGEFVGAWDAFQRELRMAATAGRDAVAQPGTPGAKPAEPWRGPDIAALHRIGRRRPESETSPAPGTLG